MQYLKTEIPDVYILEPKVFADARGYFMETYVQRDFDAHVRPVHFIQDNESRSSYGVLRGLHYQQGRQSQSKLIRVMSGRVLDVAVDLRVGSPAFGRHVCVELSDENHRMFFIPRGFAHGFVVLSPTAVFQYKCDNYYAPASERAIAWNDPELDIRWPVPASDIQLSPKDMAARRLRDCPPEDLFDYNGALY
ncbi:MAG: dTDP-4-dehydrorhamnose 3,5-epimerase [Bacteroidales bacterium]|nr:dTDP-4-dehydrorhamnose 3,5-epimerase [Bacteroidales bacterium]